MGDCGVGVTIVGNKGLGSIVLRLALGAGVSGRWRRVPWADWSRVQRFRYMAYWKCWMAHLLSLTGDRQSGQHLVSTRLLRRLRCMCFLFACACGAEKLSKTAMHGTYSYACSLHVCWIPWKGAGDSPSLSPPGASTPGGGMRAEPAAARKTVKSHYSEETESRSSAFRKMARILPFGSRERRSLCSA